MSGRDNEGALSVLPSSPSPREHGSARVRRPQVCEVQVRSEEASDATQQGRGALLQQLQLLTIKERDLEEAVKDNEDNGKAKAFLGIVTVGRKVSMLAKIATSLGLSPRSGVSQPQQGSRPPINTALAALLSPRRPVSYAGSPCGTTPGPALAAAVTKSLVLQRGKEAFLGLSKSPRLSQRSPRSSAATARSPRFSQWTPRSSAAGAYSPRLSHLLMRQRLKRAEEDTQWLLYNPRVLPPEHLVSPRQTLGDFFHLSGGERQALLRLELERCGIPVEPTDEEKRLEAGAKALLRVTRTGRRMIRASARAKLRRAMRKLRVVLTLRAAAKGGAGAGPRRTTHKLHRVLYMPPLKRTWEDIDKLQAFLKTLRFFAHFNTEELCSMARAVTLHEYHSGEVVFEQGAPAGSFFLVLCGTASSFVTHELQCLDGVTTIEEPAGTYEEQDTVGLEGCLCDLTRQSRLVADGRLELLQVSRDGYLRVARRMVDQRSSILRQVPALRLMPTEEIEVLAAAMELRNIPSGTRIWTQGEACDGRTAAVLVLHGELGLLQDLRPNHNFATRRTRMVKQTGRGVEGPGQGTLKAATQTSGNNGPAAAPIPPVMCTTQMLSPCTQRLANGDGRPQGGSNPKSKPFRLRVTPHDIFKTLTGGSAAADAKTQNATPRRQPTTKKGGGGACEEGRYYDVCLATVSCLGMVLTREGRRDEEAGRENVDGSSKPADDRASGADEAMPASADEATKPTRAFSLVALGMAQVGVLSRGVLRQVMHRNRWALAPLLEVEATAPPDHVLHSILRRQRWWEKYKRRHVALHTQPSADKLGRPSGPTVLREADSPSLADLRISLSLTLRTQASTSTSAASTQASTLTSAHASASPVLRRCEVVLPLRVPLDEYPLSRLHALGDDDPEVLDTHVGLLESFKGLPARPAPPTTWASKWVARLKRPSRLMKPAAAALQPAAALPSPPPPIASQRTMRFASHYKRNRPGRRLTGPSAMHQAAASAAQSTVGDSRSTISSEGIADMVTSRSESAASASTDTSVLLHVMLSEPSLDSQRPLSSPGTQDDPEVGQWQPWTSRRQLREGQEQLATTKSRWATSTSTPMGLRHMMGAFVEEELGTESESESGRSADGLKRKRSEISPMPSPRQPLPTRWAGGEGTRKRPEPPKARLANTFTPRLVKQSAARRVVAPK